MKHSGISHIRTSIYLFSYFSYFFGFYLDYVIWLGIKKDTHSQRRQSLKWISLWSARTNMNMKMCEASNMNLIYECYYFFFFCLGNPTESPKSSVGTWANKKHVKYLVIFGGQITLLYIIIYILYIHICDKWGAANSEVIREFESEFWLDKANMFLMTNISNKSYFLNKLSYFQNQNL